MTESETLKLQDLWIVIDGSIYTKHEYPVLTFTGKMLARKPIAFNVSEVIAKRIVELHNRALAK